MHELGLKKGVEVGTSKGINAVYICENNPGVDLTCVDPYMKYHWKHSEDEHERCYAEAKEKLSKYPTARIMRTTSMEGAKFFKEESLDFVYIDGNHEFDFVMEDLIAWGRKVRKGGIISLHDFYHFRGAGVVQAVETYTRAHQIHEWFICDYLIKTDKEPEYSVFWIKP